MSELRKVIVPNASGVLRELSRATSIPEVINAFDAASVLAAACERLYAHQQGGRADLDIVIVRGSDYREMKAALNAVVDAWTHEQDAREAK